MSPRMSAEERREQVLNAAIGVFARFGYEGATTSAIAQLVGVTQPYLFKLFPSKKDLFLAASKRNMDNTVRLLREAAGGKTGQDALQAMGEAYSDKLATDRAWLQMQLQTYAAACEDKEIQLQTRESLQEIWNNVQSFVRDLSNGDEDEAMERVVKFFATGMFCNVIAAVGSSDGNDPVWVPILDAMGRINGKQKAC